MKIMRMEIMQITIVMTLTKNKILHGILKETPVLAKRKIKITPDSKPIRSNFDKLPQNSSQESAHISNNPLSDDSGLEDFANFVSRESEVIYEGNDIKDIPFLEVEQDLVTVYMPHERSSILTLCGAIGKLPDEFWVQLKKHGIKYKDDNETLCRNIMLPEIQKSQMSEPTFGPFFARKKAFFKLLDNSGVKMGKSSKRSCSGK